MALVLVTALALGAVLGRAVSRSAEVAARFALDALPGAQAALEADLKQVTDPLAGPEARRALLTEARSRGAADGAARILLGDALFAPLLGAAIIILPALLGESLASLLSPGVGVAALLLAAAIPAAAALAQSLSEQSHTPSARAELFAAGAVLSLLFLPGAPFVSTLLAGSLFLALYALKPRRHAQAPVRVLVPRGIKNASRALSEARQAVLRDLGAPMPPMEIAPGEEEEVRVLLGKAEVARAGDLQRALIKAAPALFGVQEAREVLRRLSQSFPAAAREISAPFPLIARALKQALREGLSLDDQALAEALALLPKAAREKEEEIFSQVRKALLPSLLARLGEPPIPVMRLDDLIEDELRRKKELGAEIPGGLRASRDALLKEAPRTPVALLCAKEVRQEVVALLGSSECLVCSPEEIAPETELVFLGEVTPLFQDE